MRILRIIDSLDPRRGGPVQMVRSTAAIHKTMGHETCVLTMDAPDASYLSQTDFETVGLGPGKFGWAYSRQLTPWLRNHVEDYELVVIHGLWQYPSYATSRIAAKLRKDLNPARPVFLLFTHGMLDPWFQSWKRRPIKTLRNILYWHGFERQVTRSVDAVLFTSEREHQLSIETFHNYKARTNIVVPYGCEQPPASDKVDTRIIRERCPELADRSYWLFLSRIHPKKGVDLLIRGYQQLLAENGKNATAIPDLVISGPGLETTFGKEMIELANPHRNRIHFPGMLNSQEKWGAFHASNAFFLPSHQENFGIVVAEALACGKRVYLSDQVNIYREILEDDAGYAAPDSEQGVKLLLQTALEDETLRTVEDKQKLAIACFQKRFNIRQTALRMIEIQNALKP